MLSVLMPVDSFLRCAALFCQWLAFGKASQAVEVRQQAFAVVIRSWRSHARSLYGLACLHLLSFSSQPLSCEICLQKSTTAYGLLAILLPVSWNNCCLPSHSYLSSLFVCQFDSWSVDNAVWWIKRNECCKYIFEGAANKK